MLWSMQQVYNMQRKSILIIDNYDSFTYNLVHLINECGYEAVVWRNDQFKLEDIAAFDKILLSPGPGIPSEAGMLLEVIKIYAPSKSMMGVCLGQQAMAEAFGGSLYNLPEPLHGVATAIEVDCGDPLFANCPAQFKVGRYHSWVVDMANLPKEFKVIAKDEHQQIMGIRHQFLDLVAVQFHPESVLTEHGLQMMKNWIEN